MKNISFDEKNRAATLFVYGYIGEDFWEDGSGTADRDTIMDLKSLEGKIDNLDVRLNCFGGSVKHAWAIANYLLNAPFTVNTYNDGMVCSAATMIYLSAKKENRFYGEYASWLFHSVLGSAYGNKFDIQKVVSLMDHYNAICNQFLNSQTITPVDWYDQPDDIILDKTGMEAHGLIAKQEEYKVEDIQNTLFTRDNIKKNEPLARKIIESYNNLKSEAMPETKVNPTPVPAALNADIIARLEALEGRLAGQEVQKNELQALVDQLTADISVKDALIAELQAKVNNQPSTVPAAPALDQPINADGDDIYVSPFFAEGDELMII